MIKSRRLETQPTCHQQIDVSLTLSSYCINHSHVAIIYCLTLILFFLAQNEKKPSKKLSSASSLSTATTTSSNPLSIKDSLIDNKEKLNDLNDQILNSQQLGQPSFHRHHHHRVHRNSSSVSTEGQLSIETDFRNNFNPSHHKSESIMSSDSDIRFTRKKLGDNQRCGCILIAGFLVMLLVAGLVLYAGCELLSYSLKA